MPFSEESTLDDEEDHNNPTRRAVAAQTAISSPGVVSNRQENDDRVAYASAIPPHPPPPPVRRHSLPASYHLSTFLSFFAHNNTENIDGSNADVNDSRANNGTGSASARSNQPDNSTSSTAIPVAGAAGPSVAASSVNRHRYGHRHTKSSVALDQPVIVRTYNPPTPRSSARAGMMNPGVYEDEDVQRIDLPPVEAFSCDGILKSINPEVNRTLDKVSYLCVRLKEDVKAEVEAAARTQREIHAQKQQAERLAALALKTTNNRCETLSADTSGLKRAVEDLAQLTEKTYTALGSIISTLLAIDELLPPQERLAPDHSVHRTHYPRVHDLLNKKYQEVNARFRGGAIASGRSVTAGRPIPRTNTTDTNISLASSAPASSLLSASLPHPTHQEPGWLRRRMSSSSTMLLSTANQSNSPETSDESNRLSMPPHLQLRTILPNPSYNNSPPINPNSMPRKAPPAASTQKSQKSPKLGATRRQTFGHFRSLEDRRFLQQGGSGSASSSRNNSRRSSMHYIEGLFNGSSWKSGKWGFFGSGKSSSTESERSVSAEERLRRVLNVANGKGKAVDRRS